ncbi:MULTISPECIES: BlaI/MecI/CopY family transcriptional regulator [Micromonospora]|uniref:CopY family transcriptional regulator n=1 Tax=Micromonospora sicca TaxID=2202420 RepID=A0A317DGG1_9ACTN|nr:MULTISPECIES: BlaI/MecI/CopY family transcriptional regulator [unclassified Micromonospora]MBM0228765.1 BlaI/MecI/CopY family transcriptional regulator [Micromonospora sp. ATA51]MDZ5443001.1 BlaI/MecI/CopY family transcriptional regulator [Micromonospora sp. 4G57]MDZ5488288.1 BlaI/MecI/CopY family transcriptional regulator [Micromonospora sp. 4G53]PWR13838.1 CopY family transcriptional regulator [Micromonospora sp. 4G51]
MESRRRRHGDLEHEILAALAAADAPLTPATVRERLDAGLAYNTVTTVLARLHGKGRVTRHPAGRAYAYQAVRDRAQVTAHQMRRLLDDDDTDRSAVLTRFVGSLTPEDEALLVTLLQRTEPDS